MRARSISFSAPGDNNERPYYFSPLDLHSDSPLIDLPRGGGGGDGRVLRSRTFRNVK